MYVQQPRSAGGPSDNRGNQTGGQGPAAQGPAAQGPSTGKERRTKRGKQPAAAEGPSASGGLKTNMSEWMKHTQGWQKKVCGYTPLHLLMSSVFSNKVVEVLMWWYWAFRLLYGVPIG
jgi:hypothetical protein